MVSGKEDQNNVKTVQPSGVAPQIVKPSPTSTKPSTSTQNTAKPAASTKKPTTTKAAPTKKVTAAAKKPSTVTQKKSTTSAKTKDNVVSMSASKAKETFDQSSEAVQNIQSHMAQASAESAEQLARSADVAARLFNETISITRDHAEACKEAGSIAAHCAGEVSESLLNYANDTITQHVETSKDLFECRTAGDVFELQSRLAQQNTDRFMAESSKMMDMFFAMATKASEPISDSLSDATDRLQDTFK